ncbi:cysteine--tRNA ligase [Thauera mechernichensis]|uniref:Cysteine--tRNA ligase n=1 Tax=Thauera mechernichensis TaxID=82788 RepID=A0ABW3WE54_9RHOO|nr:cysteine--tRNA ligase [Thauera mechernichensis]MDG3063977.1 cysteine--tRNA ligase [Thauera mechernichensis]
MTGNPEDSTHSASIGSQTAAAPGSGRNRPATIRLHNTLRGQKEIFAPHDPQRVTMYVCGPTVYNFVHIGNARPVVVFDVLYRLLSRHYPQVVYARNITDIDDKINAAAQAAGEPIRVLAERFAAAYREDMAGLNALPPGVEPWATDHVPQMIMLAQQLIERGHAYVADGHVLFHVPSLAGYGKLSGRRRDEMIAGARVEVAPYKRDPADFVLWKPSTDSQPGWDSPWGFGRPGWHIECTAMIHTHLGRSIDIHGGGQDLIFPHHENEIAQGEGAYGGEYCRYWVHNGYVTVDGEKMSKSLGNFRTVRDLLQHYPGEVIRYALLAGHYRKPLDFSLGALDQARAALDRLYGSLLPYGDRPRRARGADAQDIEAALADDLNTPLALARLHETAAALRKCTDLAEQDQLLETLRDGADLLGLLQQPPGQWRQHSVETDDAPSVERIEALIATRSEARAARDFTRADALRHELIALGVGIEDGAAGTTWHRLPVQVSE